MPGMLATVVVAATRHGAAALIEPHPPASARKKPRLDFGSMTTKLLLASVIPCKMSTTGLSGLASVAFRTPCGMR